MIWFPKKKDSKRIDTENFAFPGDKKRQQESLKQAEALTQLTKIQIPKSKNYMVNYTTSYVQSSVDNQFASSFYQNYTGPTSISPGFSGFFKVGISDLMDDYKLTAGVRLAANCINRDFGRHGVGEVDLRLRLALGFRLRCHGGFRIGLGIVHECRLNCSRC